jgi:formate C-acetyltransferase
VLADWDTQIRYYTRKSIEIEYVVDTMLEENVHDILCSALVDDCIERAKSIKQGGANMTGFPVCRWASPTSATAWRR